MIFEPMTRVFPEQAMWGARLGLFSFIITEEDNVFSVSAREAYAEGDKLNPGQLERLGDFDSMQQAVEACTKWYQEHLS